ncbi:Uncharacterized protein APZ42_006828 [Daphnia magna]|uniref:Uncharacterized protein n=1 Tax=Daphnia magna TaxID=35525 RepID=A0A164FNW9_9CRUS|nr:Uncharacterized protein APZ42_006828 [Daphnia magna]
MFVFPCVVKGPTGWPKAPTPLTKSLPKSTFLPNPVSLTHIQEASI